MIQPKSKKKLCIFEEHIWFLTQIRNVPYLLLTHIAFKIYDFRRFSPYEHEDLEVVLKFHGLKIPFLFHKIVLHLHWYCHKGPVIYAWTLQCGCRVSYLSYEIRLLLRCFFNFLKYVLYQLPCNRYSWSGIILPENHKCLSWLPVFLFFIF